MGRVPPIVERWRPARVPLWAIPAALALSLLAGALPLQQAVTLPVVAGLAVLSFVQPLATLALLVIAIPMSSLAGVTFGDLTLAATEPLAALLGLGWLLPAALRREIRLEGGALLPPLFAVSGAMLASAVGAIELGAAANEIIKWAELLVVFLYVASSVRRSGQVFALLAALFLAGVAEAAVGLFQFATGAGPSFFAIGSFLRAYGTFGQPNPFAGYLGTTLPLAVALLLLGRPQVPRWLWLLALGTAGLTGAAILASLSRGTWLSVAGALTLMLLIWDARTRRLILPAALGLAGLGLLAALGALPSEITERLGVILDYFGVFDVRTVDLTPENFAVVERMAHWQAAWYMFLEHPLLGVGIGNYAAAYPDYFLPGWPDPLGHAHNYFLNTAAEMGIIGLITLLWMLVAAYVLVATGIARAHGQRERALLVGVLGSLVVFTIFSGFDDLLVHGIGMQLGLLLGLAYVAKHGLDDTVG